MTHNAAARAAALALLGTGAATENLVLAEPSKRCAEVRVEVDSGHQKVYVDLKNACEARVGCRITWSLRCGRGQAQARSEQVWLDGRGAERLEASAASCGDDDWEISPPRWRCDETRETQVRPRRR